MAGKWEIRLEKVKEERNQNVKLKAWDWRCFMRNNKPDFYIKMIIFLMAVIIALMTIQLSSMPFHFH